ncbi:RNA-binding motif protein, X-linked 2-like [Clavelina lepadiformis]|uniref:RNA-binding motif protein, X-linked 2-like n=1 Tax=Clavelina lepadiformis TaxID=159417 RepID=UPI004041288E
MNILTKIRLINELNDKELRMGVVGSSSSWHNQYKDSAWLYVGGIPYELSEGDLICIFSQYGEIVNINLIRDKKTGKSKGFAFICYEDQRSTVLAVDNLNGTKIKGRQMRVDHVMSYKVPKEDEDIDELTQKVREKGVAPDVMDEYETKVKEEVIVESDESDHEEHVKKKKKKEKKKKGLSFLKETPKEKEKRQHKGKKQEDDEIKHEDSQFENRKKREHSLEKTRRNSSDEEFRNKKRVKDAHGKHEKHHKTDYSDRADLKHDDREKTYKYRDDYSRQKDRKHSKNKEYRKRHRSP